MKWMRFRLPGGAEAFGVVEGDEVLVHEGALFGESLPTGQRVPLAQVQSARHVMVLQPLTAELPARPPPVEAAPKRKARR